MALNDYEKEKIIGAIETMDEVTRAVVLASLEAFSEWLANTLYNIYLKIKSALKSLWQWLCAQF